MKKLYLARIVSSDGSNDTFTTVGAKSPEHAVERVVNIEPASEEPMELEIWLRVGMTRTDDVVVWSIEETGPYRVKERKE